MQWLRRGRSTPCVAPRVFVCITALAVLADMNSALGAQPAAATDLVANMPMVSIPAGVFQMGDLVGDGRPAEHPVHTVKVKRFKLAKYEVTVGQFGEFIATTGYRTEAERNVEALPDAVNGCGVLAAGKMTYTTGVQWNHTGFGQTDAYPVVCVSWNDAQEFIRWLNRETHQRFRLPSEAEWEYAARAKTTTSYFWGNDADQACNFSNAADQTAAAANPSATLTKVDCEDGYVFTSPVGHFKANAFGVYDILGNAREWTADCASNTYEDAPSDGSPWLAGNCLRRMARGSSWFGSPGNLKIASRGHGVATARDIDMGFRLARDD